MGNQELAVIDRTYELLKWYLARLEKFPRSHRYGLGQRIEARLYGVFELLVRAKYRSGSAKIQELTAVNLELELVRMLSRLAHELGMIPHKSQEYATREMNEIGRMIGGWLRQQQCKTASSTD